MKIVRVQTRANKLADHPGNGRLTTEENDENISYGAMRPTKRVKVAEHSLRALQCKQILLLMLLSAR